MPAAKCMDADGDEIAVEPDGSPRRWFWVSGGEKPRVALGTIPAKASRIATDDPHVRLAVALHPERSASEVELGLHPLDGEGATPFRLAVPPDLVHRIHLPVGKWSVTAAAEGHLPGRREDVAVSTKPVDLGVVTLTPSPSVVFRVLDSESVPVAGAVLREPLEQESLAVSNPLGEIVWHAPEATLPPSLLLEASGYASEELEIRQRAETFNPGAVVLHRGATLTVKFERPDEIEEITAVLVRNPARRYGPNHSGRGIGERRLTRDQSEAVFQHLAPGTYALRLSGAGPLELLAREVRLTDSDQDLTLEIEPFVLDLAVLLAEQPLGGASVDIGTGSGNAEVKGTLTTDDMGKARVSAWSRDLRTAYVRSENPTLTSSRWFELGDASVETVVVRIDDITIRGRLTDKDTGRALGDTQLPVNWKGGSGAGAFPIAVVADGSLASWSEARRVLDPVLPSRISSVRHLIQPLA